MEKERHKNIPASYLILIKDNKILLQKRFNTGYEDGKYTLNYEMISSYLLGNFICGEGKMLKRSYAYVLTFLHSHG